MLDSTAYKHGGLIIHSLFQSLHGESTGKQSEFIVVLVAHVVDPFSRYRSTPHLLNSKGGIFEWKLEKIHSDDL